MSNELIRDVSDTAHWVASYRARESLRKDALFQDPLADRLAGERGHAIARQAPIHSYWAVVTRTKLIDEYVLRSLADGCNRVLNLAAGFDTRPYRLALPPEIEWVEVDLPGLIAEKERLLADQRPRCKLERRALDLADAGARAALLARYSGEDRRLLIVTEGLVIYLDAETVSALARDFSAQPAIREWVLDFNSPRINADLMRSMGRALNRAAFKFAPSNGLGFFENLGWKPREVRSLFREGARCKRVPLWMRPFALFPDPDPRNLKNERWTGVVRFERA